VVFLQTLLFKLSLHSPRDAQNEYRDALNEAREA
jgi:hypothetical protein